VRLDLLGEQHVDFEETGLRVVMQGYSRLRLPNESNGRAVAWNRELAYSEIEWVGILRRRQWEMMVPAVIFLPLGLIWTVASLGEWGPLAVSLMVLTLLGIVPMVVFLRGRAYVGIATRTHIVVLPADRGKKALRRILGLLRQQVPASVPWEMEGSAFQEVAGLDNRPPTGRGFDHKRYAAISALMGLYGLSNLLARMPGIRWVGAALGIAVMVTGLIWVVRAAWRKANWR
jgi:hypothetical protein